MLYMVFVQVERQHEDESRVASPKCVCTAQARQRLAGSVAGLADGSSPWCVSLHFVVYAVARGRVVKREIVPDS